MVKKVGSIHFNGYSGWKRVVYDPDSILAGHSIIGFNNPNSDVVPGILHAVHAGMDDQHRAGGALRRGVAGGRIHFHIPLLQHAFPAGKIPDGHRDFLRSHLEDRNAS